MSDSVAFTRYIIALAFRVDRRRALIGLSFGVVNCLFSLPLLAVTARLFVSAATSHHLVRAEVVALGVAVAWLINLALIYLWRPVLEEIGDLTIAAFDAEIIALCAGASRLDHLENPAYADRLDLLRASSGQIFLGFWFTIGVIQVSVQLVLVVAILGFVMPILLLLPLFALPTILADRWSTTHLDNTRQRTAEQTRLARHLLTLTTLEPPAKEIRIFALATTLRARQRAAWDDVSAALEGAQWQTTAVRCGARLVFACAYIGALVLILGQAINGHVSVATLVMVVVLTSAVSARLQTITALAQTLEGASKVVTHLRWLSDRVAQLTPARPADLPVPPTIRDEVALRGVTFAYPEASRPILKNIDLRLPAGAVVALVGDNGAGKSTLVKLLCRFYEPSTGSIAVDGTDIARYPANLWQSRLTASFQDFVRFELLARETIGVGDLDGIDDDRRVRASVEQADATKVIDILPEGLDTALGRSWTNGAELSGGQWQKLAIARTMMRDSPLMVILDEPTAALDAAAEEQLFASYAQRARTPANAGTITLLVTHRLSTVRMADLIVVIDDGQVREQGTHEELMARNDLYAELYRTQARAYAR